MGARTDTTDTLMPYRPFVRWWWNGDKVDSAEIVRELQVLQKAGIGGVEINPIAFPQRCDSLGIRSLTWLSDEWIRALRVALVEAKRLGMQCDLLVGSGWPFGSETLAREDRAQVLLTYAVALEGGKTFVTTLADIAQQVTPMVTEANPERAWEVVSLTLTPDTLHSLSDLIDATPYVTGDTISITLPEGHRGWLYAVVRYESFASVINGAPGAAGSMLDHMNREAVSRYLHHMSDKLEQRLGPMKQWLRAYFVDSMELEGSNWTSDFAAEFRQRRGYDVEPWLPLLMFRVGRLGDVVSYGFGASKTPDFQEQVNRVRYDFELTKAELLHERYTETFLLWCQEQGVSSRAQAYGRGFFPLESSLGYTIPEGESWTTNYLRHRVGYEMGDEDYRRGRAYTMINKYVSSAAHLSGRRVVSAEEMTNTYMLFNTSLELLKVGSDMNAFVGVTHSVWHGYNYTPPQAGFPGWVQYGSYYNEQNTWWPYFHLLNDYRARLSRLLQHATMMTDIAIVPPYGDLWSVYGVQTEPFPQFPPTGGKYESTQLLWEAVHKNGGNADLLTDRLLQQCSVKQGRLCYGNKTYDVLILSQVERISVEAMQTLLRFAQQGGRVLCVGYPPSRSLGLDDWEAHDTLVYRLSVLLQQQPGFSLLPRPADGHYLEWYQQVQPQYHLPHSITIDTPNRFVLPAHYRLDDGRDLFLLVNASMEHDYDLTLSFSPSVWHEGLQPWLYDANTGQLHGAHLTPNHQLPIRLEKSQTMLIILDSCPADHTPPDYTSTPGATTHTLNLSHQHWHLRLDPIATDSTAHCVFDTLTDLRNTDFADFAGTITYTTTLHIDSILPQHIDYLDLGAVYDICELRINGHDCGTQWYGNRHYTHIGQYLHAGDNTLEVKVTTLLGNYAHTLSNDPTIQHFVLKRRLPTVPTGLVGPVLLGYGDKTSDDTK